MRTFIFSNALAARKAVCSRNHLKSGVYARPSLWVHLPRSAGAPCWYCHVWQRGGNLFDFLLLYYGLDARSLWQRILSGETF